MQSHKSHTKTGDETRRETHARETDRQENNKEGREGGCHVMSLCKSKGKSQTLKSASLLETHGMTNCLSLSSSWYQFQSSFSSQIIMYSRDEVKSISFSLSLPLSSCKTSSHSVASSVISFPFLPFQQKIVVSLSHTDIPFRSISDPFSLGRWKQNRGKMENKEVVQKRKKKK